MPMTKARRHQLIRVWTVLALAAGASIGLEIVLLEDGAALAVAITTTACLGIGIHLTRRTLAPHKRAVITVGDLRGRPRPVRRGA
jgi:hypothetical protein